MRRVEDGASDVAAVTGVEIGAETSPLRRAWSATTFGIGVVATGTRILFAARDPRTRLGVRLGTSKGAAWTRPLDLDRLKQVSRALDVSLNDVLARRNVRKLEAAVRIRPGPRGRRHDSA